MDERDLNGNKGFGKIRYRIAIVEVRNMIVFVNFVFYFRIIENYWVVEME